tara:strand:+ start:50 stop:340 length:291 start_codon:yes stop_codon:yes gene_type:complete
MAKTKVLNTFTGGAEKFLEQNAGVSNIIISNITTVSVKASVRVGLPEGNAYIVKNAVIPVGTSLLALDNQLIQTAASKISVETDTTSGIEVVYTAL